MTPPPKVIELNRKTVVSAQLPAVIVGVMMLLGVRFIPGMGFVSSDKAITPETSELLIYKMDTMLTNQAGLVQKIRNLEIDTVQMGGRLDNVEGDVRELKDALNRVSPWPGEDYP